jgi:putative peptidoglycan lipid II flippase
MRALTPRRAAGSLLAVATFLKHFRTVSGLTVVSRLTGLARDAALAYVLGAGWVMDAYSMAFRMPNLLRQLLGEGALSAAFIPVFTDYLEKSGRQAANRFMSLLVVMLLAALAALTLTADGAFLLARYLTEAGTKWHLIFGLAAVLFPFGIMVCLVALLQAALNCRQHFAVPALAPVVLNLGIIGGATAASFWFIADPVAQVYFIAAVVLVAGVAEILIQVPIMRRLGLVFRPVWDLKDAGLWRVLRLMGPVVVAVGVVQINVFMDSIIANVLSPNTLGDEFFQLGSWTIAYPMKIGAASVLYYGPLFYSSALGVFGIALATVIFPVLSQYAVRKDFAGMARTASHALRLAIFIGVPVGLGIILVCEPVIRLCLNHGRFADPQQSPQAVERTAWVASIFALGLGFYAVNHILNRAFYAMEEIRTPRRVAMLAAGLNFVCNLLLVWPMAEGGLALATVISAVFQTVVLAWLLDRRLRAQFEWRAIGQSAARTVLAAAAMGLAAWATVYAAVPALPLTGAWLYAAQLTAGAAVGALVFAAAAQALSMTELHDLLARAPAAGPDAPADLP